MAQDTFIVAKSELDMDLEIGETGMIMIPVEVMAIDKQNYTFRKFGRIKPEGEFKPETVVEMRRRIGVEEQLEKPLNEE